MTTKAARLRANKSWRTRTGLKLVQAWLPLSVVERLDRIARANGARGRAALLIQLIQSAPAPGEPPRPAGE